MNYELAKRLKDAGFPQLYENPSSGFEGYWYGPHSKVIREGEPIEISNCYIPTLEELIEACPKDNFRLEGISDVWTASLRSNSEFYAGALSSGNQSNPIEAVAKLWLALTPPTEGGVKKA